MVDDRYDALERFSKLRDEGVLSDEEFAAEKAKLLGGSADNAVKPQPDFATLQQDGVIEPQRRSKWPLVVAGAVVVIIIALAVLQIVRLPEVTAPTTTTAASGARHTPTCNSTDARDLLTKAISREGGNLMAVYAATERSFDPSSKSRICAADLTLASGGSQHRGFRLLPASDGASYQLEFVPDPIATAASVPDGNSAAATNTSEPTDDEAADDAAYYKVQAKAAAKKIIEIADEDGDPLCCVNVGDVVRYFSGRGASATYDTSDDGHVTLDVKDPAGRWRALTAFELNFAKDGDSNALVKLVSLTINGEVLPGIDTTALFRGSFNLRKGGTAAPEGE